MSKEKNKIANTQVKVPLNLWHVFKAIVGVKGENKNAAFAEAIRDYNEKNKGVLG